MLRQSTFNRLLQKIETSFCERMVYATFDNDYYFLAASFDVPADKIEIEFYQDQDQLQLTDANENCIIKLMQICYDENISNWNEENIHELQHDQRCHRSHARREENILN